MSFLLYCRRYVSLLHDEMQIRADLVFDAKTGELVGFINKPSSEKASERDELATHVLVFYVVGINSKLSMSLGFFPTKCASSASLYTRFWQAVGFLELKCGLKVRVIVWLCARACHIFLPSR